MNKYSLLAAALCLTLSAYAVIAQPSRRVMAPADILRIANVGDPQISPDGERVVYTVTTVDANANGTTIWMIRIDWSLTKVDGATPSEIDPSPYKTRQFA